MALLLHAFCHSCTSHGIVQGVVVLEEGGLFRSVPRAGKHLDEERLVFAV